MNDMSDIGGSAQTQDSPGPMRTRIGHGALFSLVALGVIAICGGATVLSDTLSGSKASIGGPWQPRVKTTVEQEQPILQTQALATVELMESEATGAQLSAKAAVPPCNQQQRTSALELKKSSLKLEMKRHHRAMWSLQTTGTFTRYFNPNMYTSKVRAEAAAHQQNMAAIQDDYQKSVAASHCQ